MALNVWVRGLSGRGFRVKNSSGARKTVKEGVAIQVDVDVVETQRILSREMDNFIRAADGSATTITIRGLHRRGFRIKSSAGPIRTVRRGTSVTVDVANGEVRRVLRRNKREWIRMPAAQGSTGSIATVRGLEQGSHASPRGLAFQVRQVNGGRARLATAMAGANNDLLLVARAGGTGGNSIRLALVNPGGTVARSISVAGNDITVNLAVTAGVINASETATSIAASLNADAAASRLVAAFVAPGDTGAGVVIALALTNLAGGTAPNTLTNVRAGASVAVDVDDPSVADTLRRENHAWVEVDA